MAWALPGRRQRTSARRIREETGLTASAGVSYCKFVAKLASDQNKPDGLCVITPERAQAYIAALPVARFHGVGPVTARKLEALGIHTGADLQERSLAELETRFGSSGGWYWRICRGLDDREVKPDRPYKSVSAERTFDEDQRDPERLASELTRIAGYAWDRIERAAVSGRTVTLKVKFADFEIITRSKSFGAPLARSEFRGRGPSAPRGASPPAQGHQACSGLDCTTCRRGSGAATPAWTSHIAVDGFRLGVDFRDQL